MEGRVQGVSMGSSKRDINGKGDTASVGFSKICGMPMEDVLWGRNSISCVLGMFIC